MHHFVHHRLVIASVLSETCRHWSDLLQESFAVCLVGDPDALAQVIANLKPAILVLQLSLPRLGRVKGLRHIQSLSPMTRTLALTDAPSTTEGIAVLKAGAKGYYTHTIEPLMLKKAVMTLQNDELWIERKLVSALVAALMSISDAQRGEGETRQEDRLSFMTPRQREVADCITSGASNKEIATRLNLSERTVKAHLSELFRNFGVFDRLQLGLLLNKLPFGELAAAAQGTSGDAASTTRAEEAFEGLRQPISRGVTARYLTRR